MAAALFEKFLREGPDDQEGEAAYRVLSAGTNALEGQPADPLAVEVMREIHGDISAHRARLATPALLDEADWIFTMTGAHRESILKFMPACRERLRLLSSRGEDIPDPMSKSIDKYRQVRDRMVHWLREVAKAVGEPG